MKFAIFLTALTYSFAVQAVTKTPKTIVFKYENKPELIVKITKPLPLAEPTVKHQTEDDEYTENCDIKYYNNEDRAARVNGHRFMYNDDVEVYIGDDQYWVTQPFATGRASAFGTEWKYFTTLVYENPDDCKNETNAIRILIGVYKSPKPGYIFAMDYQVGWERNTNIAYLINGNRYEKGTVIEWH